MREKRERERERERERWSGGLSEAPHVSSVDTVRDPTAHSGSQHDDVKDDEPHGVDACKYCAGHYRDVVTVF